MPTPFIGSDDISSITALLTEVRNLEYFKSSITLVRNGTPINPQIMVVEMLTSDSARLLSPPPTEYYTAEFSISGPIDLDIQIGDKFNWGGQIVEVTIINPDRLLHTVAYGLGVH